MKFEPIHCPECGEEADGVLERLSCCAYIEKDRETGEYQYAGETDMWWDEQRPILTEDGRYQLVCHNGHDWPVTSSGDTL